MFLFGLTELSFADERLNDGMNDYLKEKYHDSLKKTLSYQDDYPEDALVVDMIDMITKKISAISLRKAYTFFSEGLDSMAHSELENANKYHSEYANKIEQKFVEYLKEYPVKPAANKVMFDLINDPQPSDTYVYDISKEIRKKITDSRPEFKDLNLAKLKHKVDKLKVKKK